jgi:hypothetical protein
MLYHMRNKPSLAGRRGKGGVRFRLILKRLLRVRTFAIGSRASRNVANQIGHPAC